MEVLTKTGGGKDVPISYPEKLEKELAKVLMKNLIKGRTPQYTVGDINILMTDLLGFITNLNKQNGAKQN